MIVRLYGGAERNARTVGTGQVQDGVAAGDGLIDKGRVGEVADQSGFAFFQTLDRLAVQQAQPVVLAQVRT